MASFLEYAKSNIESAASALGYGSEVSAVLERPKNVVAFDLPLPMSDGSTKIFKAWRVQHNDARGPYKGGIRFHPASNLDEVQALASLMTWKTSLAGIPYGGAKGALSADPKTLSSRELEALSRSYARRIFDFIGPKKDIPAPDVGTNPQVMAWMTDEYSRLAGHFEPAAFTGKPVEIGGSFGRDIATGFGGLVIMRELLKAKELKANDLRVAIQGFGAVGSVIARLLYKEGYRVIALSDSKSAIYNTDGIDVEEILKMREEKGLINQRPCSLAEAGEGKCGIISKEELLESEVDVLIPAALENVVDGTNAKRLRTKVILEMANGPVTPEAETILSKAGVEIIPDILANSGGVIGSYLEWVQGLQRFYWEEDEVFEKIKNITGKAWRAVVVEKNRNGGSWREASYRIAVKRVAEAMRLRGWI